MFLKKKTHVRAQSPRKEKSAPETRDARRHADAFNARSGPGRNKRGAALVLEKPRASSGLRVGCWGPEDPLGADRRRGEGRRRAGFPGSAHLAAASGVPGEARPCQPGPGLGSPML